MKQPLLILTALLSALWLTACSPVIVGAVVVATSAGGGGGGGGGGGTPTQIRVVDVVATEGENNNFVTLTLDPPIEDFVVYNIETVDGTAVGGVDFTPIDTQSSINPLQPMAFFSIQVLDNDTFSANRQFTIRLSSSNPGVVFVNPVFTVTILEDEADPANATRLILQNTVQTAMVGQPLNPIQANVEDESGNVFVAFQKTVTARFQGPTGQYIDSNTQSGSTGINQVRVGDVNGDGRPDVVTLSQPGGFFAVFLNTTPIGSDTISFAAPQITPTATLPLSLELAQINDDNRLDVLVSAASQGLFIHRQDPLNSGQFLSPQIISGLNVQRFKVRDMNNDQLADIVVASSGITLLLQIPSNPGSFSQTVLPTPQFNAEDFAIRDFNSDGLLDILLAGSAGSGSLFIQNSGSPESYRIEFEIPNNSNMNTVPGETRLADMNGDGALDVVSLSSESGIFVFFRNPANLAEYSQSVRLGKTRQSRSSLEIFDIDQNGLPDITWNDNFREGLSIMYGDSSKSFGISQERVVVGFSRASVAQADLNGDGRLDILTAFIETTTNEVFTVYLGELANPLGLRANTIQPAESATQAIAVDDLNQDGKPDLVVAHDHSGSSRNSVLIHLQETSSPLKFRVLDRVQTGQNPVDVKIGDLNNDGRKDILVCEEDTGNARAIFQNSTHSEQFDLGAIVILGVSPRRIEIGDLNADGRNDFVGLSGTDSQLTVAFQSLANPGQFTTSTLVTATDPSEMELGDFNQDGRLDILVGYNSSGILSFFFQDIANPGQFLSRVDIAGGSAEAIRSGDLNNDGITDFIVANRVSTLTPYFQNPLNPGQFSVGAVINLPIELASGIEIADVNGDGRDDIAFATSFRSTDTSKDDLVVAFQSASVPGQFINFRAATAGRNLTKIVAADFDGDGRTEFAINSRVGHASIMSQDSTLLQGARLTGNSVVPTLGVANFNNLIINGRVDGAQLEFISPGLTSASSNIFNVR